MEYSQAMFHFPYPANRGMDLTQIVYLPPLEDASLAGDPAMRFRLTYEGELKASQKDPIGQQPDKIAEHKQAIRKVFHRQLKHLWATNKFLREHKLAPTDKHKRVADLNDDHGTFSDPPAAPMAEVIANQYRENDYRFVPLVREEISLLCSLNILFLRRDIPGSVFSAGDLDNRIKTLIDCLRKPKGANELRGNEQPAEGENPFYCLLEDDNVVTGLVVETDTLLDPPTGDREADRRQVKIIITVELKPLDVTLFNLSFA